MVLPVGPAMAETSNMYDNFTRCPTSSPAMNDPSSVGVVCASSVVRGGLLKIGNFQAPITAPLDTQFAMVYKEEELPGWMHREVHDHDRRYECDGHVFVDGRWGGLVCKKCGR